jgi:hypothetical protein
MVPRYTPWKRQAYWQEALASLLGFKITHARLQQVVQGNHPEACGGTVTGDHR